jgi:hypothetical protein
MHLELRNRLPFGHRHSFLGEVIRKALIYRGLTGRLPFVRKHRVLDEIDAGRTLTFIGGVGIGMGLMYLLDPDRGSYRRSRIREAAVQGMQKTGDAIGSISSKMKYEESMGERLDLH